MRPARPCAIAGAFGKALNYGHTANQRVLYIACASLQIRISFVPQRAPAASQSANVVEVSRAPGPGSRTSPAMDTP